MNSFDGAQILLEARVSDDVTRATLPTSPSRRCVRTVYNYLGICVVLDIVTEVRAVNGMSIY